MPVPFTTESNGSSATFTGTLVLSRMIWSIPRSKLPPPATIIPLSSISAANSGGVCSKAVLVASIIWPTGSARASQIWAWLISISLGTPLTKSLPLTSILAPAPSLGILAVAIPFFILSV